MSDHWQIRAIAAEKALNQIDDLIEYRYKRMDSESIRLRIYEIMHRHTRELREAVSHATEVPQQSGAGQNEVQEKR